MRSSSSSVGKRLPLTTIGASLRLAERLSRYSLAAARSWALTARTGSGLAVIVGGGGSAPTDATGTGRGAPDGPDGRAGGFARGFGATLAATFAAGAGGACLTGVFATIFLATGAFAT